MSAARGMPALTRRSGAREPQTSRQRRPWLLISNCQAQGLGNSLNLLSNEVSVEQFHLEPQRQLATNVIGRLDSFERILVTADVEERTDLGLDGRNNVWRIPHILFQGYHPDVCYVTVNDQPLKSALGSYHSIIAYAAFRCGQTEEQTLKLYREEIYESLGYFDYWNRAREKIIDSFRLVGIDISQKFIEWSRRGPFMHTINHPHIFCLRDLAELILQHADLDIADTTLLPHDNLANGPVFPVYPEIGSRLGVRGNYTFKRGGGYECFSLAEFVSESFHSYRGHMSADVKPAFDAQVSTALSIIEAVR